MAYSQINQADADPLTKSASYNNLTSDATPSSHYHATRPLTPLSLTLDDFTGAIAGGSPDHADTKISKFISSLTSSSRQSYDLVEEDDYEITQQQQPDLTIQTATKRNMDPDMTEDHAVQELQDDLPMRTASISRKLPLNHPKPDLQSLQGAYVKNVERLEESAEQLSIASSLEEELQRMKQELRWRERTASDTSRAHSARSESRRHQSNKSISNSIVDVNATARSGGYSPSGYVASPVGSIRSPQSHQAASHWGVSKSTKATHTLPEPEYEGRPLDSELLSLSPPQEIPDFDPRSASPRPTSRSSHDQRPNSSGSGDTYQQAKTLFTDFDGVHYSPERAARASRRISLSHPPRARDSRAFKAPQPGEEMIYYPAPVPVMLNLPVRLSKMNWSDQEKKRLRALSEMPDEMRKSAAWLANEVELPANNRKSIAGLPPQLRASAFFDQRGSSQDVQLKDGSAVATLDSILDAAAHAPVSAFTDHPIAGHLGDDFYGTEESSRKSLQILTEKKRRKSSMSTMLGPRASSGNLSTVMARESRVPSAMLSNGADGYDDEEHIETEADRSIAPDADEMPDPENEVLGEGEEFENESESESEESAHHIGFSAAPTTLLAELQMRKAQQRMRNRTAADAFPNGMHSTLLELDTVTQLQQKARRQKHVKLAWEDREAVDKENFDDDEIPLGLLFPEKERANANLNRPLGLMEKKELEENEPLSHRRARLRGEPLRPPAPSHSPGISQQGEEAEKSKLDLPLLEIPGDDDNQEGETLGQRRQRIKERKEKSPSTDFARQTSSELGLNLSVNQGGLLPSPSESKTPDIEETLGQRRKRLQAEALSRNVSGGSSEMRPTLRTKQSLADVLYANPVGYVDANESKTANLAVQNQQKAMQRNAAFLAAMKADRERASNAQNVFGNGHSGGLLQQPVSNYQGYQQPFGAGTTSYVPGVNGPIMAQQNYGLQNGYNYPVHQQTPMNASMGFMSPQMSYPYQYSTMQGFGYQSAVDLAGMGPPLDSKQRAVIEGWRQGVM